MDGYGDVFFVSFIQLREERPGGERIVELDGIVVLAFRS
jgi:hypothetical protein